MQPVIDIKNLSVIFGKKQTLYNIEIKVPNAKILAIIGPSGSGKSTTLHAILNTIKNTGKGTILGFDYRKERNKILPKIGYVPQLDLENIYLPLTPFENVKLFLSLYNLEGDTFAKIQKVFKILDISPKLQKQQTGDCSGGEKKRVSFAMALAHEHEILFLDEPTTGLDELLKINIFSYLKRINYRVGTTIVLISHNINLCEWVDLLIVLKQGKILTSGPPRKIIRESLPSYGIAITIEFANSVDIEEKLVLLPHVWKYLEIGRNKYKFFCHLYDDGEFLPKRELEFFEMIFRLELDPRDILRDDATLLDYFLLCVQ